MADKDLFTPPAPPLRTVDVGIAQLSMHSIREMCGTDDVDIAYKHFVAFYEVREYAMWGWSLRCGFFTLIQPAVSDISLSSPLQFTVV